MFGTGGAVAATVIAAAVIAGGVAAGMIVSGNAAAEATKEAARMQAEAQKFSAEQQRLASDHEADLLFKTEQADRSLDEKYRKEDLASEKEMMAMFDMIDESTDSAKVETQRKGETRISYDELTGGDYSYPEPCDDMIFS